MQRHSASIHSIPAYQSCNLASCRRDMERLGVYGRTVYRVRDQLTVTTGFYSLATDMHRIPESARPAVLRVAHDSHPGTDAFLDTLRTRVWWPGLSKDAVMFTAVYFGGNILVMPSSATVRY